MVIVIGGLLTAFALPQVTTWRQQSQITSARQTVAAAIATARAAAVQKGYLGYFYVRGDTISVSVDTAPINAGFPKLVVIPPVVLTTSNASEITTPSGDEVDSITFDPRGFALPRGDGVAAPYIYLLVSGLRRDSVCVARMGQILPRGCTL